LVLFALLLSGCKEVVTGMSSTESGGTPAPPSSVPAITAQPANAAVTVGQSASFSVKATGTGTLTYQWEKNSLKIAGATAATYTTSVTTAADSGSTYAVVVSDGAGSATSNSASLVVSDPLPPALSGQPQNQTVQVGQAASFSVSATGTGTLTYQWQKNSVNIDGAVGSSYTTPAATAADSGSTYAAVVSDSAGSVTSSTAVLSVQMPAQASYYVALNGSDSADGSAANPFRSLQRAQVAMEQSSIKVTQINGGTYYPGSTLTLTAADQGETWEAAPGATVVLSGGVVLTGWSNEGNGVYSASAPGPVGLDLSIAGVRQMPAALGYDARRPFTSGWRILSPNQPQQHGMTFTVQPGDLTASVKPGAVMQVVDFLRYTDQFTTVVSVDASDNTVTVADNVNSGTTTPGVSGSWRILGDSADLGGPGEFAYDAAGGKVYVEPANPETIDSDTVVAAELKTLIALNNVSGVTIAGLIFSDTVSDRNIYSGIFSDRMAAVMGTGLSNSSLIGNTFVNAGNGIALLGSSNNTIAGNSFSGLGGAGILVAAKSNHNQITNNTMVGLSRINVGSMGIDIENSANNLVDSNTIDGTARWGISLFPTDNVSLVGNTISNNVLRNTSQQTNDTGAIYSYAGANPSYTVESTTITGNRIENLGGLLRDASGEFQPGSTEGIYMDDQVSGVTMSNNVIESNGSGMFLCHGCKDNSATNNVIVLQPAAYYDRGANGISYATGAMTYNGTTRVDLLPSYFPAGAATTAVVVRLSGRAAGGANATFNVQADGVVIGVGTATSSMADYVFTAQLTPHQVHRIGIGLTNGVTAGTPTTELNAMELFVNNTAVGLATAESEGKYGGYGFLAGSDSLFVTHFSSTHNIVYRDGGLSQDMVDWSNPGYVDPNPGTVDYSVLYQNVMKASDSVFGAQLTDAHSQLVNPMFTNPEAGDYTLQAGSPALSEGFVLIGVPLDQ
jgi:parallel beta-helix repeat protein